MAGDEVDSDHEYDQQDDGQEGRGGRGKGKCESMISVPVAATAVQTLLMCLFQTLYTPFPLRHESTALFSIVNISFSLCFRIGIWSGYVRRWRPHLPDRISPDYPDTELRLPGQIEMSCSCVVFAKIFAVSCARCRSGQSAQVMWHNLPLTSALACLSNVYIDPSSPSCVLLGLWILSQRASTSVVPRSTPLSSSLVTWSLQPFSICLACRPASCLAV